GIGLPQSYEAIPQRDDPDGSYWKNKNADYVAMLKSTKVKDEKGNVIKGKDGKEMTRYQQRLAAYTPIWEPVRKLQETVLKASIQSLDETIKTKTTEKAAKEKQASGEKGAKKADLEKEIDTLVYAIKAADQEKEALERSLPQLDLESQLQVWSYAAD